MSKAEWIAIAVLIAVCLGVFGAEQYGPWRARRMEKEFARLGAGKKGPIVAVLKDGRHPLYLDDFDPVSSVDACMDYAHYHGGGVCEVRPGSLGGARGDARFHSLKRRWDDVLIGVK